MRESVPTCDGAGAAREVATVPYTLASEIGDDNGWKHLARHVLMSGQDFCGQSGHGFRGLWQGIWSGAADAVGIGPAMASALDVVMGMATSAPSMATMPRTANQRCNRRLLTGLDCHTLFWPATIAPLLFLTNELALQDRSRALG